MGLWELSRNSRNRNWSFELENLVEEPLVGSRFITSLCTAFLAHAAMSIAIADEAPTGRELAHSYDYGNCLACHSVPTDKTAVTRANIAPPLFDIKSRFPDKDALFDQI
jgi:hypothetical protein